MPATNSPWWTYKIIGRKAARFQQRARCSLHALLTRDLGGVGLKTEIIEGLGQTDLLLPSLIAEGLAANDRVKVRLSILQAAARRVRDPQAKRFDLENECRSRRHQSRGGAWR